VSLQSLRVPGFQFWLNRWQAALVSEAGRSTLTVTFVFRPNSKHFSHFSPFTFLV